MKFFLALLASQQTLAESGVDGSCVAEEVSLMQSRPSAAKENETVQVAAGRRRSPAQVTFYLSPPGAPECFVGESVSKEQCNGAVRHLAPSNKPEVRGLQVGSGGSCHDGSWGQVPNGCSAQSGGDWAAHFRTGSTESTKSSNCVLPLYQLVCTVSQQLYWAPYGQKTCNNGGNTVSELACASAVNFMYGAAMSLSPLAYRGWSGESCNGNGWGNVPDGCSARNGDGMGGYGDGQPHFKVVGDKCASDEWQLLCTTYQGSCLRCYD